MITKLFYKEAIQSIVFDKDKWTIDRAKEWLKKKGYKYGKVDTKKDTYRFRQVDPKKFTRYGYSGDKDSSKGQKALKAKGIKFLFGY